jgi:hypothetical protein
MTATCLGNALATLRVPLASTSIASLMFGKVSTGWPEDARAERTPRCLLEGTPWRCPLFPSRPSSVASPRDPRLSGAATVVSLAATADYRLGGITSECTPDSAHRQLGSNVGRWSCGVRHPGCRCSGRGLIGRTREEGSMRLRACGPSSHRCFRLIKGGIRLFEKGKQAS